MAFPRLKKKVHTKEDEERYVRMYKKGLGLTFIISNCGVRRDLLKEILARHGVEVRKVGRNRKI